MGMPPRDITAEDFKSWLTPREALATLDEAFGKTEISKHALIEYLKGGMVQAVSNHSVWDNRRDERSIRFLIPSDHWERYDHSYSSITFWVTAQITLSLGRQYGTDTFLTVQHFGVKFEPQGVQAMIPDAPKKPTAESNPVPEPTKKSNKGGRPPKEWWDDFWIEICRQIYDNELKPKSQADLERAMLDWVTNNGHDVGETVIKSAAKKLFWAWKLGVKN